MPPLLVTCVVVATWAWFAAMAASAAVAMVFALALGFALFASWLKFAYHTATSASKASESLMQQLGQDRSGGRRLNIYDQASGLYNRAYLELRLQEEFLRCNRYELAAALVTIKLGAVKLTAFSSDTWGALAADLARTMANTVRTVDTTAALAPLEFAICLVHCDREGANKAIDRLLRELDGHEVTVGLAVYPEDGSDARAMIEMARQRARSMSWMRQVA